MFNKGDMVWFTGLDGEKVHQKIKEILGAAVTFEGDPEKKLWPIQSIKPLDSHPDWPVGGKARLVKMPTIEENGRCYGDQHFGKIFEIQSSKTIGRHTEIKLNIPMKDWVLYPEHLKLV